jgi:hypothetical protein
MKRIIAFTSILTFVLLFYNNAANWHLHILPNGIIIEHAHPYSKTNNPDTPFQKHSHNKLELLILGLISSHLAFIPILIVFTLSFSQYCLNQFQARSSFIKQNFYQNYSPLRAPPSLQSV